LPDTADADPPAFQQQFGAILPGFTRYNGTRGSISAMPAGPEGTRSATATQKERSWRYECTRGWLRSFARQKDRVQLDLANVPVSEDAHEQTLRDPLARGAHGLRYEPGDGGRAVDWVWPSTRQEGEGGGPFAGIRNRHSPFLSQGLCGATTAVP
jgi:hypothetical protein